MCCVCLEKGRRNRVQHRRCNHPETCSTALADAHAEGDGDGRGSKMFGRMMVSALALTGVAYAQEAPTTPPATTTTTTSSETAVTPTSSTADRLTYEPAQFARFNPQTALDMVNQIPGFTLDGG